MVFWIGKFLGGVGKQLGTVGRAKKQEWDENSIRVILIDEFGQLDDNMTGQMTPAGLVLVHQMQRVIQIRAKYRDRKGRPTVILFTGSYRTEDIQETYDIVNVHKGEPVYSDMRDYQEVEVKTKTTNADGKEVTAISTELRPNGDKLRVFSQAEVSAMVYRVVSARVNNMFQEPSFNFTILMSAAAFACGLIMGAILYALFL